MKKPKYVIFDCDGVLIDSEILANRVAVEIKTELGFPITLEEQLARFVGCGMSHPAMIAELERLPKDYMKRLEKRCAEVYEAELKAINGVLDTLERLKLPKCVASSSEPEHLEKKLAHTGLIQFFPKAIFHGRLVERPKPEPDLFLHAAKALGWAAEDCLVIEDSEHGIRAGRAAGMIVCGFTGASHIYPGHAEKLLNAGADYIVSDIRNILRIAH